MPSEKVSTNRSFDVLVVGAGISGINAAYRLQTETPDKTFTVLESRGGIGGTWDFFKYPGIRSDSDLHTFGFPWQPWTEQKAIADGESIVNYIKKTAAEHGIDKKIRFHHKLISADWSSDQQSWKILVDADGEEQYFNARFLLLSTGYYDYTEALPASIPGLDTYKGTVVHPQFWPEDLDYANKKVVIIGSGATAITLLPNLADKAAHVTMLQRSPSYLLSVPGIDPLDALARRLLPTWVFHKLVRLKFLVLPFLFFTFCRVFPKAARGLMRAGTTKQLPKNIPHDPHFQPAYNPWEQRMCVCPDGDFFRCLHEGKADIATGHIETVTAHGITLQSGQEIEADIIVTATGLKMQLAGGARLSVDGQPVQPGDKFMWKGAMLQDLPNAAFVIGYTNASWTLGADATALLVTRLLKHMDKTGMTSAVPHIDDVSGMKVLPTLNLNSTYISKAKGVLPKASDVGPWRARSNYFADYWGAKWGDINTGLQFSRVSVE